MIRFFIYVLLIVVLAAVIVPNFVRAKTTRSKHACADHVLPLIAAAKRNWARSGPHAATATPTWADLKPWINPAFFTGTNQAVICISGGAYSINSLGRPPTCSLAEHTRIYLEYHPGTW